MMFETEIQQLDVRFRKGAMRFLTCVAATAVLLAVTTFAAAQPNSPAITDADFALQGEYAGLVDSRWGGSDVVGLQVVALGGGKFDAVAYRGGLPGAGWNRQTKCKLSGQVVNGSLVLLGNECNYLVAGGVAISLDATGRLTKVDRVSPTMGLAPPASATVLFDGSNTELLSGAKVTADGLLQAGVLTKMPVDAFRLHLEFRTPFMPAARGQARGNSGVYIQQRYELQILDSFGLEGIENECGGLYRQTRPELNMCLPPLAWQTYDVWFTPPQFAVDGQTKMANARITALHNGVPIHLHREITAKTGGGKPEGPEPFPINLQDHGNPVTFRNIWIVPSQGDETYGAAIRPSYGCR
jgi:3-keto-disaccharide hydrolase